MPQVSEGGRTKWTVAVWVAGDNNLDSFGATDLGELKKVGSSDDVAVIAQFDRMGDGKTRRYYLRKETSLENDVVQELGETDTGDPQVATAFFTWAIGKWPSDKVLAVIWNHGSGIDETDVYARATAVGAAPLPRGRVREIAASGHRRALFSTTVDQAVLERAIAYDDTSRDFLDNKELQKVLADVVKQTGRRIDILGFDACLMNMVEVAYQLKDSVDYIVGSEETEPGDGWPYEAQVRALATAPDAAAKDVAPELVRNYLDSYKTSREDVTQSAIDVSRVGDVAEATKAFAATCMPLLSDRGGYADFSKAVKNAQRFHMKDFADFGDLCSRLGDGSAESSAKDAAQRVHDSLFGGSPFVIASGDQGVSVKGATGTAVYFPIVGDVQVAYEQLDFAGATDWGKLITKYQEA
jgi:Clostripain family